MRQLPKPTTVQTGHQAEDVAAEFLVAAGYTIRDMNWRRPNCEIDIVAYKQQCLHFVEVKFREHDAQGGGLDYITPAKLRRMRFGAKVYSQATGWRAATNVAAIEVSGPDPTVTSFIESISYDA